MSDTHSAVQSIRHELRRAFEIRNVLEEMGEIDPEAMLLSIESETNLSEALIEVYDAVLEQEVYLAGLSAKIAELDKRKSRIDKSIESLRRVIFTAMERAGLPTVRHPCATISLRNTAAKVVITDEAQLPGEYLRYPDPVPDKARITDDLKAGKSIPGASLSNGGRTLSIRVK